MTGSTPAVAIAQDDVDALLARLKELRAQLRDAREDIAPLEANLALAYEEFQAVVGYLRRQAIRLQGEINSLRAQIDAARREQHDDSWDDSAGAYGDDDLVYDDYETGAGSPTVEDPDALEKDRLLEHLFRVLDPMMNDEDAGLLGTLQGLCDDPAVGLADALEELPWDRDSWRSIWGARNRQEDLDAQHRRLKVWEAALTEQLESVRRATESLQEDRRYALWQRRQEGSEAWRTFLNRAAEQQKDDNEELERELEGRREEWARIVSTV